jgi:hypothetical protein
MHKLKQIQDLGNELIFSRWLKKQMKRLQNLGMVGGDDRNDTKDMENIEH